MYFVVVIFVDKLFFENLIQTNPSEKSVIESGTEKNQIKLEITNEEYE